MKQTKTLAQVANDIENGNNLHEYYNNETVIKTGNFESFGDFLSYYRQHYRPMLERIENGEDISESDRHLLNFLASDLLAAFKTEDSDESEEEGEEVAEAHELTAEELREEEREQVQEFVPWLLEQETPTEWHYYANGGTFGWQDYESDDATEWERRLFASIADGTHPKAALYNRYARMYARQKWEEHADDLRAQWAKAFSKAKADPEGTRVIVETNEEDPSANCNPYGRYYMVDGSENESCIEHAGQWVVIRVDTVTSPYEVHRPNWHHLNGYADSWTQLACRCENPNNVTRWARKMIDAGRVTDIYADCY